MSDAVERWRTRDYLSFADAYLAVLATQRGLLVFTKNVRDFEREGVTVPQPLPADL